MKSPKGTFAPDRGKAVITPTIMQPVYVGESGAPGKSDFFERSTRIRTANYVSDKLN